MYQMSNGSRYSYFSINDESNNSKSISDIQETTDISYLKSELKDIEAKLNNLSNLYSKCMVDYEYFNMSYDEMSSEMQRNIINKISEINLQKKDLINRKSLIIDQIEKYPKPEIPQNHTFQTLLPSLFVNNSIDDSIKECDKDLYSSNSFVYSDQLVPKCQSSQIIHWSLEVFNYTCSRTLNKQKYLSPGLLLRETRDSYGHYNYTYFNDQKPEEMEVFDYTEPVMTINSVNNVFKPVSQPIISPPISKSYPVETSRTIYINDIINRSVDSRHVIILRGLPGSGKSTFCQAFKEKEINNKKSAPRILSIDHFFIEDGKFEYNPDLEPTYRHELFKLFKRQIDEGFFSVILIDCINEKIEQFGQFYQYAKMNGFQVSVLELRVSPTICAKRSEDRFSPHQVYKMADDWEETPNSYEKLDATSFLQDSTIEDVEMEDIVVDKVVITLSDSDSDENFVSETGFFKSKWDEDFEDTKERLDGVKMTSHEPVLSIKEYLKIEMENLNKSNIEEKGKHVKWADFEELKKQKRRKELGFVAGNTDWAKLMSSDIDVAEAALVQVKFFTKESD